MTFMIVDDSAVLRTIVKTTLANYGYSDTIEAEDGEDALKKLGAVNKKIDLFILDINMPKLNGLELLKEIRKKDAVTPVIMLTTESDKEKIVIAKTLGTTRWIIKPFEKDKFIKIIDMLVKK